jgi:hypothetical protein
MEVEGFCLFWWWRQVVFGRRLNRGMFLRLLVIYGLGRQLGQASRDRFLDKLYAGLSVVLTGRGIACGLVRTWAGWSCQNLYISYRKKWRGRFSLFRPNKEEKHDIH